MSPRKTTTAVKPAPPGPPTLANSFLAAADREEREALDAVTKSAGTSDFAELVRLAEEMKTAKEAAEDLEAQAKEHKDRYNELRKTTIPELMRKLGIVKSNGKGSFTFAGGKVHLETKVYASCTKANEALFFTWCRKNGAADLIKETVNAQTLSAFIRDRRSDGYTDPPGVATHEEIVAKMTK